MNASSARAPVSSGAQWKDLRDWLAILERHDQLQSISSMVDPNEELAAITYMASRELPAKALLFEAFTSPNPHGAPVMIGRLRM